MVAAVSEASIKSLFQNSWMFDILKLTLIQKASESRDLMLIEKAFQSLEKYFLLIVQQPWKKEFREIKMYGGFYRSKIKALIHDCEHIFERAGYMVLPDKCTMMYRGQMDQTFLLILAFDCRLSQIQCKAMAEHYGKMISSSVSLGDYISIIFSDEYTEDMFTSRPSQKYVKAENTAVFSNVTAPPAVPKREPIISAAVQRENVKPGQELYAGDYNKQLMELAMNARFALPPRTLYLPSDTTSQVFSKPQLFSGPISDHLSYIASDTNEIIPELPEGTCEDHMRESIRAVKQQAFPRPQVSDEWRLVSRNIPAMNMTHFSTTNPYSGEMIKNSKPDHSRDEGIDMSTSKSFSINSKYSSYGNQQIMPNKHTVLQQASYDPGNPESIYSQSSALMQNLNQQIYLPPNIVPDGTNPALHRKMSLSRQNALPPHLPPPRALKPTQNTVEDSLYSQQYLPGLASFMSQYPAAVQAQISGQARMAHPTLSAPAYLSPLRTPETEHVLHRERPLVYKSSSLRVGGKDPPLSEQIATTRLARSMDMTFWECPSCNKMNSSPNVVCSACSQVYPGANVTLSDYNKTQAMF
ncbi:hypothetical protein BsWGS_15775 [Bradybaena similaris]